MPDGCTPENEIKSDIPSCRAYRTGKGCTTYVKLPTVPEIPSKRSADDDGDGDATILTHCDLCDQEFQCSDPEQDTCGECQDILDRAEKLMSANDPGAPDIPDDEEEDPDSRFFNEAEARVWKNWSR